MARALEACLMGTPRAVVGNSKLMLVFRRSRFTLCVGKHDSKLQIASHADPKGSTRAMGCDISHSMHPMFARRPTARSLTFVLDRSFDDRHGKGEMDKVELQTDLAVEYCIHRHRSRRGLEIRFHIANFGGVVTDVMESARHSGLDCSPKKPWNLFPKEKLIILSPNSDNVLLETEEDKVYVVCGIVDRLQIENNISLDYANQHGILHARLPLVEFVRSSKIHLPFNRVMDFMARYELGRDWGKVLSDLPKNG